LRMYSSSTMHTNGMIISLAICKAERHVLKSKGEVMYVVLARVVLVGSCWMLLVCLHWGQGPATGNVAPWPASCCCWHCHCCVRRRYHVSANAECLFWSARTITCFLQLAMPDWLLLLQPAAQLALASLAWPGHSAGRAHKAQTPLPVTCDSAFWSTSCTAARCQAPRC
jgi:hypothetical protein